MRLHPLESVLWPQIDLAPKPVSNWSRTKLGPHRPATEKRIQADLVSSGVRNMTPIPPVDFTHISKSLMVRHPSDGPHINKRARFHGQPPTTSQTKYMGRGTPGPRKRKISILRIERERERRGKLRTNARNFPLLPRSLRFSNLISPSFPDPGVPLPTYWLEPCMVWHLSILPDVTCKPVATFAVGASRVLDQRERHGNLGEM